ncbi:MAG: hypothetical protein H6722_12210 [Sandaracinus sp.]|nr:hypothetical protein [Sandaracinus sp.]MCB9613209.1 hypothetical protein [Sandaracinus sp.]
MDTGPLPTGCSSLPTTTVVIEGTTSGAPRWERPFADGCPATSYSAAGSSVPRTEHFFCNDGGAAGVFDFELSGAIDDSYLIVYDGLGIPANDFLCLASDDEGGSDNQAAVRGLAVGAGARITVVVTGFGNSDWGSYQLAVTRR